MDNLLRPVKNKLALVLLALTLTSVFSSFTLDLVFRLIFIVAAVLILEYLFWKIRGISPFLPSAGLVTALIIFLLADTSASFVLVFAACFVSVFLKQFLRFGTSHIFNPAASGLFAASLLGLPISWWGATGTIPLIIILLGAGWVSLKEVRQHMIIVPYVLLTFVLSYLFFPQELQVKLVSLFFDSSFWFFALIMLPEPMTAAHKTVTKVLYGGFIAALTYLLLSARLPFDPLLASLLFGNLLFRIIEDVKFSPKKPDVVAQVRQNQTKID